MSEIERREDPIHAIPSDNDELQIGQWFWVAGGKKDKKWLACVIHVGTNYAEMRGPGSDDEADHTYLLRIHFDDFDRRCVREMEPEKFIAAEIGLHQNNVRNLMSEVKRITASLGVRVAGALPAPEAETQALAVRNADDSNFKAYKNALVKAKDKTLPELFSKIERENKMVAAWMEADLIPIQAQVRQLEPVVKALEGRIFNVELYAGLTEQATQIADGEPAPIATKVSLMQRRAYMDEECLAAYKTGGMEFKDIGQFDKWLAKPENRDRIMPHPRCIIAFRVRRNDKRREAVSLLQFIQMMEIAEWDKLTFLYIRNGDRLYRLETAVQFGAKLFPDISRLDTTEKLHAKLWGDKVQQIITEGEWLEKVREEKLHGKCGYMKCKVKGAERCARYDHGWSSDDFHSWTPESVYYDDINRHMQAEMEEHNRLVLILQGLLDRSMVLHPHPPWKLFEQGDFMRALDLVFDESRALTEGPPPDFEAYRAKLNASLATGSVTVGQEDAWERREAVRENERIAQDWRRRHSYDRHLETFRPYGDPGPGTLARVAAFGKSSRRCTYHWTREPKNWFRRYNQREVIPCSLVVEAKDVLNVDAYKPGDFRQFFNDPRTRADYLQWAPLLLEAEEYHAGNRKVGPQR